LLKGKRAIVVLASGGVYSNGPAKPFDFTEPYLRTVLGFIGITDVEVVRVEPVANSAIGPEKSLASARTQSKHVLSPTRINNNTKQATINKKQQIGGPLTRRRHKQKKKRKKL